MEASANVRRAEPTPRREQDGETYSAATRSLSTSTQPITAPSTAAHTSCSRIALATRSAAPRVAHRSACSLDMTGTASARMARRRILASASSSAASARRIWIKREQLPTANRGSGGVKSLYDLVRALEIAGRDVAQDPEPVGLSRLLRARDERSAESARCDGGDQRPTVDHWINSPTWSRQWTRGSRSFNQ
jgi:hypothetical protein